MSQIMVVDDSFCVRQAVGFIVRNCGYDVVEAEDGVDALTKLDRCPSIILIVTDLAMPRLDGVGLIKALRSSSSHRFIPIITIGSDEVKTTEGQGVVATESMPKPFRPEQLVEAIRRVLHDHKDSSALADKQERIEDSLDGRDTDAERDAQWASS